MCVHLPSSINFCMKVISSFTVSGYLIKRMVEAAGNSKDDEPFTVTAVTRSARLFTVVTSQSRRFWRKGNHHEHSSLAGGGAHHL